MVKQKEYIKQSEFCRRLSISRQGLQKAVRRGRVKLEQIPGHKTPRIEWFENRRSFVETSRTPSRYFKGEKHLTMKLKSNNYQESRKQEKITHAIDLVHEPEDPDGDFNPQTSRLEAEAIKQLYLAKQAKLKFLKDAGLLIEADVVEKEWQNIAIRVQKAMLSIPDRVSEVFASCSESNVIHKMLDKELRYGLSSLVYNPNSGDTNDNKQGQSKKEIKTKKEIKNSKSRRQTNRKKTK